MTTSLSHILKGSAAQSFRGLTNILAKAKTTAEAAGKRDYMGM